MTNLAAAAIAAAAFFAPGSAMAASGVLIPPGYKMDDYRSPVPDALPGAKIVTGPEAHALWKTGAVIFIDVMPHVTRPPNLPPEIVWRGRPRENIPRSAWLPDVGYGQLSALAADYFRRSLERLTGGEKSRALLFYCIADCWMSWNAAKRAVEEYGYSDVTWFPEGTDAWTFEGYPLAAATPEP